MRIISNNVFSKYKHSEVNDFLKITFSISCIMISSYKRKIKIFQKKNMHKLNKYKWKKI